MVGCCEDGKEPSSYVKSDEPLLGLQEGLCPIKLVISFQSVIIISFQNHASINSIFGCDAVQCGSKQRLFP
jgi:hypothetical protein